MNIFEIYNDLSRRTKKRIILDTDTFNEVDDQFTLKTNLHGQKCFGT